MGNQLALTLIFLIAILLLLVFNELAYRRFGSAGEVSRKFAHFAGTLTTITFPYLFSDHWYVLMLAIFFFILLFASRKSKLLKSIHGIDRKSVGSYLLPFSIYLTYLIAHLLGNKFLFILPMLVLAICDPIAGILGLNLKKNNHNIYIFGYRMKKTLLGSGSFLVSCFIISVLALYFHRMVFDLKVFLLALGIAVVSTLSELFSWRGTDNLAIPLSVLLMLVLFL